METKQVFSENPEVDLWRMLLYFSYPNNIESYFKKKEIKIQDKSIIEIISGSILQAKEYFDASKNSSLQISPLLLYYGASNLVFGGVSLVGGKNFNISDHGIRLNKGRRGRIADIELQPLNNKTGALTLFAQFFNSDESLSSNQSWTLQELFSSIPDILEDVIDCYDDAIPKLLPVEIVKEDSGVVERISEQHLKRFDSINAGMCLIPNYKTNYLSYQHYSPYIILRRKLSFRENGIFSLTGQKFIELFHVKNGKPLLPAIEIKILMILFALGFVCRYQPEIWNPFVRSDLSGEKLIIEKIIDYIGRILPNLILNKIKGKSIRFSIERSV